MAKILIIRLSSFGDIVLTTPLLRCLKIQSGAEIHYLVKKKFYPVLSSNPHISHFHIMEQTIRQNLDGLKKENFDVIIDLHNNFRSIIVKNILRKPAFTVNKLNTRKWIMVNLKLNTLPDKHIVDRYLETVKPLGITNDGLGLEYHISPEDETDISSLPLPHQNGYIAFVTGGNYFTKKLPPEKIISICKKIGKPVVLLGGKEDFLIGERIVKDLPGLCFNACGKYNINQSASLLKQATKVISHDTGLMHIAAALKKEIISVWGNTVPEFGMYPYYGKIQVANYQSQVNGLTCRPCSKLGFGKCPEKHFNCMTGQNENEIARQALLK